MAYSNTITAWDFSAGLGNVRVSAGYTWQVLGEPDQKQEAVPSLDIPSNIFQPGPHTFSYPNNLVPPPSPAWYIALWIQEIPRIVNDTGWLFRSGAFTTEPPADPIEVILAPEQFIGKAELANAVSVPYTTPDGTTITAVSLMVVGTDIALSATGTDTRLPHGDTFTFLTTLVIFPNASVLDVSSPLDIRIVGGSLTFSAAPGHGFAEFFLNAVSGIVLSHIAPQVREAIKAQLNQGILTEVATRLNLGAPMAMPQGVVLSIRGIRSTTRTTGATTEMVIGVNGALAAFGGVMSKFPALSSGGSGIGDCFIATAAMGPNAPELRILRTWRDEWLRCLPGGAWLIAIYEYLSPPLAQYIASSSWLRAMVRRLFIAPVVRFALYQLRSTGKQSPNLN